MKKILIAIIVAAVAVVAFYGSERVAHASTHDNTATVQNDSQTTPSNTQTSNISSNSNNRGTSSKTSNSNNANTPSNSTSNSTSNNNNNNNNNNQKISDNTKNQSNIQSNTGTTEGNTISQTKQSNHIIKTQTPSSQSVDFTKINSTGVLSSETADYFAQQLEATNNAANTMISKHQQDQSQMNIGAMKGNQMITNLVNNKIIPAIQSKLSGAQLTSFNNLVSEFNQFNQNSVLAIDPNSHGGSILPLLQYSQAMGYEINFATYLIGGYVNTGVNPLLADQFANSYTSIYNSNPTLKKFIQNVSLTQNQTSDLAGQMNQNNANDVLDTYNKIYGLWNTQIDNVYNYIKTNSGGNIGPQNLTSSEKIWISFRDNIVSQAGNGLTGVNKEIAEKRMAIRMTQLQTYNLMGNLSSSVGIHY